VTLVHLNAYQINKYVWLFGLNPCKNFSCLYRMLTNYNNIGDWFYLVTAVIIVDFIVIVLAKYPGKEPYFKVKALNTWYDRFGIFAVGSDVLSILIGICAARYIYTFFGFTQPFMFIAILVLFQLFHDLLFYAAVIQPMPVGENAMIDVFKAYGEENGAKILVADGLMMVGSVAIGSVLKGLPNHVTVTSLLLTLYSLCYIVYTIRV